MVGIALGLAASFFEPINEIRGSLAAWAFMSFGLVYLAWGLRQARKNAPHSHAHPHRTGTSTTMDTCMGASMSMSIKTAQNG